MTVCHLFPGSRELGTIADYFLIYWNDYNGCYYHLVHEQKIWVSWSLKPYVLHSIELNDVNYWSRNIYTPVRNAIRIGAVLSKSLVDKYKITYPHRHDEIQDLNRFNSSGSVEFWLANFCGELAQKYSIYDNTWIVEGF